MNLRIIKLICIVLCISMSFTIPALATSDIEIKPEDKVFDNSDSMVFTNVGNSEILLGGYGGSFIKTTAARFCFPIEKNGVYKLYVYNPSAEYEAAGTIISVRDALGTTLSTVDFLDEKSDEWIEIGLFEFSTLQNAEIIIKKADAGNVKADALKLVYISSDYTFDEKHVGEQVFLKDSEQFSEYYNILLSLDIYREDTDNYNVSSAITRAQAARILSRLLGMKEASAQTCVYFEDIPTEHTYSSYVNFLAARGIVIGDGSGLFRPDDNISRDEFTVMLLRTLGYDYDGYMHDFNTKYHTIANELNLLDNTPSTIGNALTSADITCMIYNALDTKIMNPQVIGSDKIKYSATGDNTLLSTYFNVIKNKGIITDNGITSLSGGSSVKYNQITINGKAYISFDTSYQELLGQEVEYYATNETKSKIIYLFPTGESKVTKIYAESLAVNSKEFTRNNIVYFDKNEKIRNVPIAKDTYVIYNGKALPSYTVNDLKIQEGMITHIETPNENTEVVIIKDVVYHVVEKVYPELNKLLTMGNRKVFEFDIGNSTPKSYIFDSYGHAISLSDVRSGNVFAYMQSKGNNPIQITYLLNSSPIGGIVTEVNSSGLSFDGEIIRYASSYTPVNIVPGTKVTAYLTGNNRIFFIENSGISNEEYGYFMAISKPSGILNKLSQIKLLTESGKISCFNLAKEVYWNDVKQSKTIHEIYSLLESKPQLIRYRINPSNEIYHIITAVDRRSGYDNGLEYDPEEFSMENKDTEGLYVGSSKGFDSIHSINESTVIFQVAPTDSIHFGDENYYGVKTASPFKHYEKYNIEIFDYDDSYNVGAIVYYSELAALATELLENTPPMIVTGIANTLDSEGNDCSLLKGYVQGQQVGYYFDPVSTVYSKNVFGAMNAYPDLDQSTKTYGDISPRDLKFGDIIQVATDADGKISAMRVLLHTKVHDKNVMGENMYIDGTHPMNKNTCYSLLYVGQGKVTNTIGNWVYYETKAPETSGDTTWQRKFNLNAKSYYFMNFKNKTLTPTTSDSICIDDEIIVRCYYGEAQEVIIVEK